MAAVWGAVVAQTGMGTSQQQQQPPVAAQPPAKPPPPRDDTSKKLAVAFRQAVAASLNKRLHASLTAVAQTVAAEADEQLRLQATLRQRGERLQAEVAALQVGQTVLAVWKLDLWDAFCSVHSAWPGGPFHLLVARGWPTHMTPSWLCSAG